MPQSISLMHQVRSETPRMLASVLTSHDIIHERHEHDEHTHARMVQ